MIFLDKTVAYFKIRPRLLTGVLLLAMTLSGVALAWLFHSLEPTIGRDELYYLKHLQIWHDSGSSAAIFKATPLFYAPPLPMYLMCLCMKLGLRGEVAGWVVNTIFFSLMPMISFLIARSLKFTRPMSICTALLTAGNPTLMEFSFTLLRENGYLFWAGLGIFFLFKALKENKVYFWGLCGACVGLSGMCRMEVLAFLPVILLALFMTLRWQFRQLVKTFCGGLAVLAGGFLAVYITLYITDFQKYMLKCYQDRIVCYWNIFQKDYHLNKK